MQYIEYWFIKFIKSPQFHWILPIFIGLILVEIVLHNREEANRRAADGISSCFGLFCTYVLTAILFGPIHHSFLEKFSLSSCLPFLAKQPVASSDWMIFNIFAFPDNASDLCYGITRLFLICLLYNLMLEGVESILKEKCRSFWAWLGIQSIYILIFTIIISSFNYIIGRLCYYLSWFESMIQFSRENAVIIGVVLAAIFIMIIITKCILSIAKSVSSEDIPVLGAVTNVFFGSPVGISLLKAAITTYFLTLAFKLISITFIKDFVFSDVGRFLIFLSLILVFIWHMIRRRLLNK